MSTNFYIRETSVEISSGQSVAEDTHIGKRSAGWVFGFNGRDFKTVQVWRNVLSMLPTNCQIVDEYDRVHTVEEFWAMADQTKEPWGPDKITPSNIKQYDDPMRTTRRNWADEGFGFSGYEFC
jgi:hypothetical protein